MFPHFSHLCKIKITYNNHDGNNDNNKLGIFHSKQLKFISTRLGPHCQKYLFVFGGRQKQLLGSTNLEVQTEHV